MANGSTRPQMDDLTAIAFAMEAFLECHPRANLPDWIGPCTVVSHHRDKDRRYIVSLSIKPRATGEGKSFYSARVDQYTGATEVILDTDLDSIRGEDLAGYNASNRNE